MADEPYFEDWEPVPGGELAVFTAEFCDIFGGCERCAGHATAEELRRLMPGFIHEDILPTQVVFCRHWCHMIGIPSI